MPINYYGKGNWLGLPEMGITEKLFGGNKKSLSDAQRRSQPAVQSSQSYNPAPSSSSSSYTNTAPSGARTNTTSSGGGSTRVNTPKIDTSDEEDAANDRSRAYRAQIENEYNDIMSQLALQESSYNTQLPITEGQITSSYGDVVNTLGSEEATKLGGLQSQQQTAEGQTSGILSKARQTYNELMSGASKFGGSAGQAYGELLGRSTASTMGEARTNLAQTLSQIEEARTFTKTFYSRKRTELEKQKILAIEGARQDTRNEIARINADRTKAQGWKSAQNLQAMANLSSDLANIKSAAAQAQRALDQWAVEREDKLNASRAQVVQDYALKPIDLNRIGLSIAPEGVGSYLSYLNNNQPWSNVQGVYQNKSGTESSNSEDKLKNWWEQD